MSTLRTKTSAALALALGLAAPTIAHAGDTLSPGTIGTITPIVVNACTPKSATTSNSESKPEWTAGIGDWKWGMDFTTDVGVTSDCNKLAVNLTAGLDAKVFGVKVSAADFVLSAYTNNQGKNAIDFTTLVFGQEIATWDLLEHDEKIAGYRGFNQTLPGGIGDASWSRTLRVTDSYSVKPSITWNTVATIQGDVTWEVQPKRVALWVLGEADIATSVTGKASLLRNGSELAAIDVDARIVGLVGKTELTAEAKTFYDPPILTQGKLAFGVPGMELEHNAWKVTLKAWRNITDAVHGSLVVDLPFIDPYTIYEIGGIPSSWKGVKSNELTKKYPLNF